MKIVQLNRKFKEWSAGDEKLYAFGRSTALLRNGRNGWNELLKKQRVVILAGAGSGKTAEMEAQAKFLSDEKKFSFYAKVEDVGRDGLENALTAQEREKYVEWLKTDSPGYFFLDSVDEAKLNKITLEKFVRQMAAGIYGAEGRATLVISGRTADWEFWHDLEAIGKLKVPLKPLESKIDHDRLIVDTINNRRSKNSKDSENTLPFVVLMSPLDPEQVRIFASAHGITNLDEFLSQLQKNDFWEFAERPLDLTWLVEYWTKFGKLGTFREMLSYSLSHRLAESNKDRKVSDKLDLKHAHEGIQRVAASLVFGRRTTIHVPDSELNFEPDHSAIKVEEILPDWSDENQKLLLTRSVLEPEKFGRLRLHNDNDGKVRAFLTSQWLVRLTQDGLSKTDLLRLFFANTYGLTILRPSMRETAAWLAQIDEGFANEIIKRDPVILLQHGDPRSLTTPTRCAALKSAIAKMKLGVGEGLDFYSLKRFSASDLAQDIQILWVKYNANRDVKNLLLRIIWHGEIASCSQLAEEAAFTTTEGETQIWAIKALLSTGVAKQKQKLANYIRTQRQSLSASIVWDSIVGLFPDYMSVEEFLESIALINKNASGVAYSIENQGPELVAKLDSSDDLTKLSDGLLQLWINSGSVPEQARNRGNDAMSAILTSAAIRLLKVSKPEEVPRVTVMSAIKLCANNRSRNSNDDHAELLNELHNSTERRRTSFWIAAEIIGQLPVFKDKPLTDPWSMLAHCNYHASLRVEDIEWLLADGLESNDKAQKKLALNSAMRIWRDSGSHKDILELIKARIANNQAMAETLSEWIKPTAIDAELKKHEMQMKKLKEKHDKEEKDRNSGWIEFFKTIRETPAQLKSIPPIVKNEIDWRLFNIWVFLSEHSNSSLTYSLSNLAPIAEIIGDEAIVYFEDAMIKIWRARDPLLKSERKTEEKNQISRYDCMGITGLALEAKRNGNWTNGLSSSEATRAAEYATLEINGFPDWLTPLAKKWPSEVKAVLESEILAEHLDPDSHFQTLSNIKYLGSLVTELMAKPLFESLEIQPNISEKELSIILEIVSKGLSKDWEAFVDFAIKQFLDAKDVNLSGLYLSAAFPLAPDKATAALSQKLRGANKKIQKEIVAVVLPKVFGSGFHSGNIQDQEITLGDLENILTIAYEVINVSEDNKHPSGESYTPDTRDYAENARSAVFKRFVETSGWATYAKIIEFAKSNKLPIPSSHLLKLASNRAAEDSEITPWNPREAYEFEISKTTAPQSGGELQVFVDNRIIDLQHDLLHSAYAQGRTLAGLPQEKDVQNWLADKFHSMKGRCYSLEREAHVVDEKEPDLRFKAVTGDFPVAVEIKVIEKWKLKQLEEALVDQLCGKYLRERNARHGILLLVHKKKRKNGWWNKGKKKFFTYVEVVSHLKKMAVQLCSIAQFAAQPMIATIDVSELASGNKNAKKSDSAKKTTEKIKVRKKAKTKLRAKKSLLHSSARKDVKKIRKKTNKRPT